RWSRALPFLLRWRQSNGGIRVGEDTAGLLGAELAESFTDAGILRAKDGGGEERGIDRAGLADGECADRDTAGHLRNGEERIETRSEEHTSELQSLAYLVCRLLLEKKKTHR